MIKKSASLALFLALGALVFTGCETPGERLEPAVVTLIKDGATRREEVLKRFGEPNQVTRGQSGTTLYFYERLNIPIGQSGSSGMVAPFQNEGSWRALSVLFGSDDIVRKHLLSDKQPALSPTRTRFGRQFTQNDLMKITPGKSTESDLTRQFGPPVVERLTTAGQRMLVWIYLEARVTGVQSESVEVLVDDSGVVTHSRATASEPSLRR